MRATPRSPAAAAASLTWGRAATSAAASIAILIAFAAVAALAALGGCANVMAPPGGPLDSIAPRLIAVVPDSMSVNSGFRDLVRLQFDEAISERNLQTAVTIYPLDRRPKVEKGKRELRVRPRTGWAGDRIYHITVDPVVVDLFNNTIDDPLHYVFSTGAPITPNLAAGTVYDRMTGRPLARGRVDMVLLPDTLRYGAASDSVGRFALGPLPTGEYFAIGYDDTNGNLRADEFDRADTARVSVGAADTLALEFHVFEHDTAGPVLMEVTLVDSLVIEILFDGYLEPEAPLDASNVEILALADSSRVELALVLHRWQYTAREDSLRRVALALRDSLAAQAPRGAADAAAPEGPQALPDRRIYAVARLPIPPGSYVVRARRIRNLSGLDGGGEGAFERQPPAAPPPEEGREGRQARPGGRAAR